MPTAGYSGTPLAKKLGIKKGNAILLYNTPKYYYKLFADFPEDVTELNAVAEEVADFIHVFCTSFETLKEVIPQYQSALKKNGMLWVSWPKGSSKIATDLKRDPIREYLLNIGLVDVKVAAVDEDWSGLKFMYRIKDRK
ncbi:DUF3052 family protein [Aquimarina spongiae]|uniref:DUF3052 domain-containing protein n=1 Tax=Aquimarina spongiae TaxID=570521 RepID=A0A1M6ATI9_9FLAO|nr:DUF3052 family protein [Aquimarina spongiae]SHI39834.1 Protein of unknown function [Aquimarina spongiae]